MVITYAADYGRGGYDVGNRLRSRRLSLPFGQGKAIFGNAPRSSADEAIGGWKFGFLSSFQGGIPFTIVGGDNGNNSTYSERANFNPDAPSALNRTSNGSAPTDVSGSTDKTFTQPAWGYYGNSSRNAIRGPGQIHRRYVAVQELSHSGKVGL